MASDGEESLSSWCEDNLIDMEKVPNSEWNRLADQLDDALETGYAEVETEILKEFGPILKKKLSKYEIKG